MNHEHKDLHMHECIRLCWECRDVCQDTLFNQALERGGSYIEPTHIRLMADCIEACQTAADFMQRNSRMHPIMCHTCAQVCEMCADSCEEVGNDNSVTLHCADICKRCANSCRSMSNLELVA